MASLTHRGSTVITLVGLLLWFGLASPARGANSVSPSGPRAWSGIFPHLAMSNEENECGTGAVVPWADRLWVITYAPHRPQGSTDKLYEIDGRLRRTVRPESVGGTPAARFIHRESRQLLIGPYVIDRHRQVRVLSPARMPGRLTGIARHLTDPARRVYYATMEEGFYEVDVRSLEVRELYADANRFRDHSGSLLPGYHGKGLFSGQGRLVYANNGELSPEAQRRPDIESGCLAAWDGSQWQVIRRNQFTEVSGPGGLRGNARPSRDPVWSIGWDHRSLLLLVLDRGEWHTYRLPKSSHAYDGAHGWNTEWPRIREIGESALLMTMHGAFWRFPRDFSPRRSSGLVPRSNYLKVIGDFCRWEDHLVLGCDDSARSEFLNRRPAKGRLAPPDVSQSNLWFARPSDLDSLGPVLGRGAVWTSEDLAPGQASDPFLFQGFDRRSLHLSHDTEGSVAFRLEVDRRGNGTWTGLRRIEVPAREHVFTEFTSKEHGAWIRVIAEHRVRAASAVFAYRNQDRRRSEPDPRFRALARPEDPDDQVRGGWLHAGGGRRGGLRVLQPAHPEDADRPDRLHEVDHALVVRAVADPSGSAWMRTNAAIPRGVLSLDAASVVYRDARGTWRLPRGDASFDAEVGQGRERVCREVCTERDLFNAHGTFYELPAENAGGAAGLRPIATHNRHIRDYASYRGLLVLSGLRPDLAGDDPHVIRSQDGACALWVGNVEDLWALGKPRGVGGPWRNSPVRAGHPSDPYLMTGYDRKTLTLSHDASSAVPFVLEVDITGRGTWVAQDRWIIPPGREHVISLPDALSAYWARMRCDVDCRASAIFVYD